MRRKERRPTPFFRIPPPYSPFTGEYAKLQTPGVTPYCAMMQIAADDEYDDYVMCRGFDTRMQKFVDYEDANPNKPGIAVAKPYGRRQPNQYNIGEIYPALLPIQGTPEYTPPSPSTVNWRLGQNPGVVDGDTDDGHPQALSDIIEHLIDHNGKYVNWLLLDAAGSGDEHFVFKLTADWVTRSADAEIYELDGVNIGALLETSTVYDTLSVATGMQIDDVGYCFLKDGKYYVFPESGGGGGEDCPADPPIVSVQEGLLFKACLDGETVYVDWRDCEETGGAEEVEFTFGYQPYSNTGTLPPVDTLWRIDAVIPYSVFPYVTNGTAPLSYAHISGTLPPGATFEGADGNVYGDSTDDTNSSGSFVAQVTDSSIPPEVLTFEVTWIYVGVNSPYNWGYFSLHWSEEPTSVGTATDPVAGEVISYTLNGTERFRLIPDVYDPTQDGFYSSYNGTDKVTDLIVLRG